MLTAKELAEVEAHEWDQYDDGIEYACNHSDPGSVLGDAWSDPSDIDNPAGCLFQWAQPQGYTAGKCGCFTQIRQYAKFPDTRKYVAYTEELTEKIRNDDRLPCGIFDLIGEYRVRCETTSEGDATIWLADRLEVFAELQRHVDQELGRTE